ncbi:MAG: cell division protein SepF [Clostridia bacterium]
MGFFDWVMKGIGFEAEESADGESKIARKERKRQEKEEKERQRQQRIIQTNDDKSSVVTGFGNPSLAKVRDGNNSTAPNYNFASSYNDISSSVNDYGTKNVVIYYPKNYEDVQKLIDYLKQGESAVIDLAGISDPEAQRILDFISGAVYALNGSTHRISGNIFLLTPEGLNIVVPSKNV